MVLGLHRGHSALAAASLICLLAGTGYIFSSFGPDMKTTLRYSSQTGLNTVSTMGFAGHLLFVPLSMFIDRVGGRIGAMCGALIIMSGWGMMWAATKGWVPGSPVFMGVFWGLVLCGNACCYVSTAQVGVSNFKPSSVGKVVGLLSACYGLSALLYSEVYGKLFLHNVESFFFYVCTVSGPAIFVLAIFLFKTPKKYFEDRKVVDTDKDDNACMTEVDLEEKLLGEYVPKGSREFVSPLAELNIFRAMCTPSLILIFLAYGMLSGTANMVVNNMGNIWLSLGGPKGGEVGLVKIYSLFSCAGRLGFGILSDLPSNSHKYRPLFWVVTVVIQTMVLLALGLFSSLWSLRICVALLGFSYGGSLCLYPTITAEMFGRKIFSSIMGFSGLSVLIFNTLSSVLVAGQVYDKQSTTDPSTHLKTCVGPDCYRLTFFINFAMMFLAIAQLTGISVIKWYHCSQWEKNALDMEDTTTDSASTASEEQ